MNASEPPTAAHMAVTIGASGSRARHGGSQRNLAIAKLMRSVKVLRRCTPTCHSRPSGFLPASFSLLPADPLPMVYDINTQLGIAFIDSLRARDLVALGEALTTVLEDRRLAPGSRICVDCGSLEDHDHSTDLTASVS